MAKIGLLGGSFNPVHEGHIYIARTVRKALGLKEVWFLPAMQNPFKDDNIPDIWTRARLIKKAIAPYRHLKVNMVETKNTVPSYSINTARRLTREYPEHEFYWIIGSDNIAGLKDWQSIDELKKLVTFVCADRGDECSDPDVLMVHCPVHPASATAIRNGDYRYVPKCIREDVKQIYGTETAD
ncbi:MAG: nicotinate (nicotinamide) nucleotide adenylyltransferase [Erysipelotrichaceae bacterium]|nr:nicotinate (nicotinamide) nucleotide adenylyltransferase [Erysipelotrichaceae bacterium]